MSIELPVTDLTNAVVGSNGDINMPTPGLLTIDSTQQLSNFRMFNESGCGLSVQFSDGTQEFIPAGAWPIFSVGPNVSNVAWTVAYVIPNAPVSQLRCIYYYPGEAVPQNVVLGNSPIGITGSVSTGTGGSTLSNEGNPAATLVVDIGDVALAKLWQIFTDHFVIGVDQSGVLHAVLSGNPTGNPLTIGQAGDITEVLGQLNVDQLLNAIGNVTVAGLLNAIGAITAAGAITGNGSFYVPSGQKYYQAGQPIPRSSWGTTGLLATGSNNTIGHGLGVVPALVLVSNYSSSGQTSTFCTFNYTSTTFEIYTYDASSYKWLALTF